MSPSLPASYAGCSTPSRQAGRNPAQRALTASAIDALVTWLKDIAAVFSNAGAEQQLRSVRLPTGALLLSASRWRPGPPRTRHSM
jgi:hypothetical protein